VNANGHENQNWRDQNQMLNLINPQEKQILSADSVSGENHQSLTNGGATRGLGCPNF
jgi:hypothetical protein